MSIPTINVNLKKCDCRFRAGHGVGPDYRINGHLTDCAATPVNIPCPIPPSVTFSVVLGECTCFHRSPKGAVPPPNWAHVSGCPAHPVKVSCDTSKNRGTRTWADSFLTCFECPESEAGAFEDDAQADRAVDVCRKLWAMIKAVVLGHPTYYTELVPGNLCVQRDAFFSALSEVARLEQALYAAQQEAHAAGGNLKWEGPRVDGNPELRGSSAMLQAWVKKLIERVGVLS